MGKLIGLLALFLAAGCGNKSAGDPTPSPTGSETPTPSPTATPPQAAWSAVFGDGARQTLKAIGVDGSDNTWLLGDFDGVIDFGGGPLTSNGDDIFLAKFSADGTHLFSNSFGDTGPQTAEDLRIDGSGNVVIIANCEGTTDFGGGNLTATDADLCVAKFTSAGAHAASRIFGGADAQTVHAVALDSNGDVVIGGGFLGTLTFDGTILTNAEMFPDAYVATLSGVDLTTVNAFDYSGGATDSHRVLAIATSGTDIWFAGRFQSTIDIGGNVLAAGGGAGDVSGFLALRDAAGTILFAQAYGLADTQEITHIATDPIGNVCVTGPFDGTIDLGGGALVSNSQDIFMGCFNSSGVHIWSGAFGDAASQEVLGMTATANRVLIGGATAGTVDFGGGPVTPSGTAGTWAEFDLGGAYVQHRLVDPEGDAAVVVPQFRTTSLVSGGTFDGTLDFGNGPLTSMGNGDIFMVADP